MGKLAKKEDILIANADKERSAFIMDNDKYINEAECQYNNKRN